MKKRLCAASLTAAVLLTGCATSVPDLSHVDNNIAGQYLAGNVLKHTKNYEDALVYDRSILDATPAPTVQPTLAPVTPDSSDLQTGTEAPSASSTGENEDSNSLKPVKKQKKSTTLSDLMGLSKVRVSAVSCQVKKSYGSQYAVCIPSQGKKLLVVKFRVKNTSSTAKKVNLSKKKFDITLSVNGKTIGSPKLSVMENDLQFFNQTIAANKSKAGVLLFEIPKSVKAGDVKINFSKGNKESTVNVG